MADVVAADVWGCRIAEDDRKAPIKRSEHETRGHKGAQAEHRQNEQCRPAPLGVSLDVRSATSHGFLETRLGRRERGYCRSDSSAARLTHGARIIAATSSPGAYYK